MYERVGVMAVRKAKVKGESKKRAEKITWIAEAERREQGGTARFPSNQRGDKQGEERGRVIGSGRDSSAGTTNLVWFFLWRANNVDVELDDY